MNLIETQDSIYFYGCSVRNLYTSTMNGLYVSVGCYDIQTKRTVRMFCIYFAGVEYFSGPLKWRDLYLTEGTYQELEALSYSYLDQNLTQEERGWMLEHKKLFVFKSKRADITLIANGYDIVETPTDVWHGM